MNFICVIIFVNLFSAQINEDNGIIEGGGFCMISKTASSLVSMVHKISVRGCRNYHLNVTIGQRVWRTDAGHSHPVSHKHTQHKIALNH